MTSQEPMSSSDPENLGPLFQFSVVNALGLGMISPFMSAYAVQLGASSAEMGWFSSSTNIANNVLQVLWGRLSDTFGRRVPFLIFGNLIVAAFWVPMMFVSSASHLIVLLVVQALLGSMTVPTWTALIGDLVPSLRLGRVTASINRWGSIGSLIATLASGLIMVYVGGNIRQMFFIPFLIGILCGISSAIVILSVKEETHISKGIRGFGSDFGNILKGIRGSPYYVRFSSVEVFYVFFMSLMWPLISITLIRVLNASMLEIALVSVFQYGATILSQKYAGRLADSIGRKPLLLVFRFGFITVPVAYAFTPNVYLLIGLSVPWGVLFACAQASQSAYLLDTIPRESRGSLTALYNLLIGVSSFFGSLLGGYLTDYASSLFGLVAGLQIVYLLSALGRGLGAATYLTLGESLRKEE